MRLAALVTVGISAFSAIAACAPDRLSEADVALELNPGRLELPRAAPGVPSSAEVMVLNRGRADARVRIDVSGPFTVDADELAISAGGASALTIRFEPDAAGVFTGAVRASSDSEVAQATLLGTAIAARDCESANPNPCGRATFDPITDACVEDPLEDGTACAGDCVTNGICSGGACVGEAVDCSSGDPCLVDACAEGTGCMHTPRVCAAPEDPCLAARCDPVLGCVSEPVADGTSCGAATCDSAPICLNGVCTVKPLPNKTDCAGYLRCGDLHCAVKDVQVYRLHTCAITTGGNVRCWGANFAGQLGHGLGLEPAGPVDVFGLTPGDATKLVPGYSAIHTCVLTRSGQPACWGENNFGQLGDGTTTRRGTAVSASLFPTFEDVGLAPNATFFTDSSGTLSYVGGEVGYQIPQIPGAAGVHRLVVGTWNVYGLDADGHVLTFGWYQPTPGNAGDAWALPVTGFGAPVDHVAVSEGIACGWNSTEARCWGVVFGWYFVGADFFASEPIGGVSLPIRDLAMSQYFGIIVDAKGETFSFSTTIPQDSRSPQLFPLPSVPTLHHLSGGELGVCGIDELGRLWCGGYQDLQLVSDP